MWRMQLSHSARISLLRVCVGGETECKAETATDTVCAIPQQCRRGCRKPAACLLQVSENLGQEVCHTLIWPAETY